MRETNYVAWATVCGKEKRFAIDANSLGAAEEIANQLVSAVDGDLLFVTTTDEDMKLRLQKLEDKVKDISDVRENSRENGGEKRKCKILSAPHAPLDIALGAALGFLVTLLLHLGVVA